MFRDSGLLSVSSLPQCSTEPRHPSLASLDFQLTCVGLMQHPLHLPPVSARHVLLTLTSFPLRPYCYLPLAGPLLLQMKLIPPREVNRFLPRRGGIAFHPFPAFSHACPSPLFPICYPATLARWIRRRPFSQPHQTCIAVLSSGVSPLWSACHTRACTSPRRPCLAFCCSDAPHWMLRFDSSTRAYTFLSSAFACSILPPSWVLPTIKLIPFRDPNGPSSPEKSQTVPSSAS
jgi:hypothetical protein